MTIIDFFIGLTLMNAMPHFVLSVWKGRMFSGFGFGNRQNLFYSLLNFLVAMSLFLYKYGMDGLWQNGLFAGALFTLLMYFLLGPMFYKMFRARPTVADSAES